jgi:hypothetical protein
MYFLLFYALIEMVRYQRDNRLDIFLSLGFLAFFGGFFFELGENFEEFREIQEILKIFEKF